MTLYSGARDGVVHLWLVRRISSGVEVSHLASLEGHPAPITCLEFEESASVLASGCKAGSIRVWDIAVS